MDRLNPRGLLPTKCQHPRVLHILHILAPPSPVIVPRDLSQPRTGDLAHLEHEKVSHIVIMPISIEKPQPKLCLDNSLLIRRKK